MKTYQVMKHQHNMVLDLFIKDQNSDISRRAIRKLVDDGFVSINKKKVWINNWKVSYQDKIEIQGLKEVDKAPKEKMKLNIIYKDQNIIVINKPSGLISQIEASSKKTVPYFLEQQLQTKVFPCHRLDKETSGALICGLDKKSTETIMNLFRNKAVAKKYYAIVFGVPKEKEWTVECFLSSLSKTKMMVQKVQSGGKFSQTNFKLISTNGKYSYIEATPITGRSHQIRIHLKLSGLPIVGDKKYSDMDNKNKQWCARHLLHCEEMVLDSETQPLHFKASLPSDFKDFMTKNKL